MASSHERAQRGADLSGVSPISVDVSSGDESVVVPDAVTNEDSARRRADDLAAEAAYYRHRAIQEEQALGPGHYVDLLWSIATSQAAMAQRIRTGNGTATDLASRRVPQPPSQAFVHNPQSTNRRTHQHLRHDRGR
jgi:hypothetical protein